MNGKLFFVLTCAPMLALLSVPASACKVVGHTSSGEPLCMTTSDGKNSPYTDARPIFVPDEPSKKVSKKPKAVQAMQIAKARAAQQKKPKAVQAMEIAKARAQAMEIAKARHMQQNKPKAAQAMKIGKTLRHMAALHKPKQHQFH